MYIVTEYVKVFLACEKPELQTLIDVIANTVAIFQADGISLEIDCYHEY